MIEVIYNDIPTPSMCAYDSIFTCRFYNDGDYVVKQSLALDQMKKNKVPLNETPDQIKCDSGLIYVENEWVNTGCDFSDYLSFHHSVIQWNRIYHGIAKRSGVGALLHLIQEYDLPSVTQLAYASFSESRIHDVDNFKSLPTMSLIKEVRFDPNIELLLDIIL